MQNENGFYLGKSDTAANIEIINRERINVKTSLVMGKSGVGIAFYHNSMMNDPNEEYKKVAKSIAEN